MDPDTHSHTKYANSHKINSSPNVITKIIKPLSENIGEKSL